MAYLDLQSELRTPTQNSTRQLYYRHCGKRVLDLCICLILLPVLAPLIAILYLIVRGDGAPGLFAHTRVGQAGRTFTCWKIRTMIPDAETRLSAVLAANPIAATEWNRTQKLQNDPRVTRLGRFLRRSSLDELPQIWNVLRGEMSLVGPRPVTLTIAWVGY
jgi:exopolysaccharide production protein ExoY